MKKIQNPKTEMDKLVNLMVESKDQQKRVEELEAALKISTSLLANCRYWVDEHNDVATIDVVANIDQLVTKNTALLNPIK